MSAARQSSVSRVWDRLSLRAKLWLIGIPTLVLVAALAAVQSYNLFAGANRARDLYLFNSKLTIRDLVKEAGLSDKRLCDIKLMLERISRYASDWERSNPSLYPLIAVHVIRTGSANGDWNANDETLGECDEGLAGLTEGLAGLTELLGGEEAPLRPPLRTVIDAVTDVTTQPLRSGREPLLSAEQAADIAINGKPSDVVESQALLIVERIRAEDDSPVVEGAINHYFVAEVELPPFTLSPWMVLLLFYPIVLTVLLGMLLQQVFVAPVHTLSQTMHRIASHKDYAVPDAVAQELKSQRGDEIGQLYSRFAELLQAIRTEKELLEERVAERTAELRVANKELDDFTHTVAHQLKEPLRNIERCTDFARRELEQRGTATPVELADTASETIRLQEMVSRLLEFARTPKQALNPRPIDLNELVARVELGMAARLAELGVVLRRSPTLPTVVGDDQLLYQVFQNLISNAARYNDKTEKWIEVGSLDGGEPGFCTVFVRDNGIGIRANDQDKVFTIFTQLHDPKKFAGGTGAGLSIVERIIKRHGGAIRFESQESRGTTFFVTLPTQIDDIEPRTE